MKKHNGFTIVELLIVIVVIAILAAITVVAYNGITAQAYNSALISSAKQTVNLVNAYIAANGEYPFTSARCATKDNECTDSAGVALSSSNTELMTKLETIGTPISKRPTGDANGRYGITYAYGQTRKWNNEVQPVAIQYRLKGENKSCNIPNVMNNGQTGPSTTGNSGSSTGYTACFIHIDGPAS